MAVQINEMVIRANIVETADKGTQAAAKPSASGDAGRDEIIKECVEIIMEMLNNKNQR